MMIPTAAGMTIPGAVGMTIPRAAGMTIPGAAGMTIPRAAGMTIPGAVGMTILATAGMTIPSVVGMIPPGTISLLEAIGVGQSGRRRRLGSNRASHSHFFGLPRRPWYSLCLRPHFRTPRGCMRRCCRSRRILIAPRFFTSIAFARCRPGPRCRMVWRAPIAGGRACRSFPFSINVQTKPLACPIGTEPFRACHCCSMPLAKHRGGQAAPQPPLVRCRQERLGWARPQVPSQVQPSAQQARSLLPRYAGSQVGFFPLLLSGEPIAVAVRPVSDPDAP